MKEERLGTEPFLTALTKHQPGQFQTSVIMPFKKEELKLYSFSLFLKNMLVKIESSGIHRLKF
jgi:hypothetical protein